METKHAESSSPARACPKCRERALRETAIDKTFEIRYEGKLHEVLAREVPVRRCDNCRFTALGADANRLMYAALRESLGLLTPEEIASARKQLGLKAKDLASRLRCAPESISRWEKGRAIQSRAMDRLLRAFFGVRQVRDFLEAVDRGENTKVVADKRPAVRAMEPRPSQPSWTAVKVSPGRFTEGRTTTPADALRHPHDQAA